MHSQFVHISLYGKAPRKGAAAWASVTGITLEGARAPGAARHVHYPAQPNLLFGVSPLEAGAIAIARAAEARDTKGRCLRCDGAVLAAAVLSYPEPRNLVEDRDAPDATDLYSSWRHASLAWCRHLFGDTLLSVVEHGDENHLHLHSYAVPELGPDRCLRWEAIHPGRAALKQAIANGADKADQRQAYRSAMQALQDDYHTRVGHLFGHARIGPRRARIERTIHLVTRDAEQHRLALEQDYALERDRLREVVEAEMRQTFTDALTEARRHAAALAQARSADRKRIAALTAAYTALQEELAGLRDDLGGDFPR